MEDPNGSRREGTRAATDTAGFLRKGTALAAGTAAAALGGHASAATITVNSLADATVAGNGQCTLREALNNANANADTTGGDCAAGTGTDTISLPLTGTIVLGGTQLSITDSAVIQGPAAGTLTIDGNGASRIFYIYNNAALLDVTISRLTLTGGTSASGSAVSEKGENLTLSNVTITANTSGRGAVALPAGGTLNIQSSVISGNTGGSGGGAVFAKSSTALTINNSTLSGNQTTGKGGAAFLYLSSGTIAITNSSITGNSAGSRGGGLFLYSFTAAVTVSSSVVSGNTATSRGGGFFLYKVNGPVTVSDTTISGNTSNNRGGGLFLYKSTGPGVVTIQRSTISGNSAAFAGGGLFFYKTASTQTLEDTTVSGNTTNQAGGGIYLKGPFGAGQLLDIRSTTMMSNTAATSGGNIEGGTSANDIHITNSIVAGGAAPVGPDINSNAAIISMNFSLLQSTANATVVGANNLTGVNPLLGPLANNGGPTQTRLPAAGSPVIDAGTAAGIPATDQRGLPRLVGPAPDMGSVEVQAALAVAGPVPAPTLSEWALALLATLVAWMGMRRMPRRS